MSLLKENTEKHLNSLIEIALTAGGIINQYRKNGFEVFIKNDGTPATEADIASDNYISENLSKITPDILVVSEERYEKDPSIYNNLPDTFWCVDPLDGTKNFINKEDEYTVNIALIENKKPIFGVIYIPAKDLLYHTSHEKGYKMTNGIKAELTPNKNCKELNILTSKRTTDVAIKNLIDLYKPYENKYSCTRMASSEKFCRLSDTYYNFFPCTLITKEWDTASGQALLEAVGGNVLTKDGSSLKYGKTNFVNGHFIALSNKDMLKEKSINKIFESIQF